MNVVLNFNRTEGETVGQEERGKVFLEKDCKYFDFEILKSKSEKYKISFYSHESLIVSTEIEKEEIRIGRVFHVRLVHAEFSNFFFLGVFCEGKLVAAPARALGNLSEMFLTPEIDFMGKIRLVTDRFAGKMTNSQAVAQIEQSGLAYFFSRPEFPEEQATAQDVIYRIESLMREVERNTKNIEALGIFDPQAGDQVLHEQPVKRNSISLPNLRLSANLQSPVTNTASNLPPIEEDRPAAGRPSQTGPAARVSMNRSSIDATGVEDAAVSEFSKSQDLSFSERKKSNVQSQISVFSGTSGVVSQVVPAVVKKKQVVKTKTSNEKVALKMKREEDEDDSGSDSSWDDLLGGDGTEDAASGSEDSGWF